MLLHNSHCHRWAALGEECVRSLSTPEWKMLEEWPRKHTLFSIGIHPWHADSLCLQELRPLLQHPGVCAIGECGIDHLRGADSDIQMEVFRTQALWAEELKLPLVLHCVRGMEQVLHIHREIHAQVPWIWHGFRGGAEQIKQLIPYNFFFSFGNKFRNEALQICPDERLLLETDEQNLECLQTLYRQTAALRATSLENLTKLQEKNFTFLFENQRI